MTTNLQTQRDPGDRLSTSENRDLPQRSLLALIGGTITASCHPVPLPKPVVDVNLASLPLILRIAEVCQYSIAKLEYSLSAGGGLRAWFKLNLLIALLIMIPALLVMPPLTLVLGTFATWAEFLASTAINLFWATLATIATAVLITVSLFVIRLIIGAGNKR